MKVMSYVKSSYKWRLNILQNGPLVNRPNDWWYYLVKHLSASVENAVKIQGLVITNILDKTTANASVTSSYKF